MSPTSGADAAGIRRAPLAILAATLFALPLAFSTATADQFHIPQLTLLRFGLLAALGVWAADIASRGKLCLGRRPLDLPVLAWSLWLLVGVVGSVAPRLSLVGEYASQNGLVTQLGYVVLLLAVSRLVQDRAGASLVTSAFLLGMVIVATYSLVQALGADPIAWNPTTLAGRRSFATLGNPLALGAATAMALPLAVALIDRGGALAAGRGAAALWLVQAVPAVTGFALVIAGDAPAGAGSPATLTRLFAAAYVAALAAVPLLHLSGRPETARRVSQVAVGGLLLQALVDSASRSAVLGLVAGAAVLAVAWRGRGDARRRRALPLVAAVAVAGAALILGSDLADRAGGVLRDPVAALDEARLGVWRPALALIRERPALGHGLDTFASVFPRHAEASWFNRYGDATYAHRAHSEPLDIAASSGLIGLALWAWLLFVAGRTWLGGLGQADDDDRGLHVAIGAAALAFVVAGLTSFSPAAISAPFWLLLGLIGWPPDERPAESPRELAGVARGGLVVAALACPLALLLAARDYRADREHASARVEERWGQATPESLCEARDEVDLAVDRLRTQTTLELDEYGLEIQHQLLALSAADKALASNPHELEEARRTYAAAHASLHELLAVDAAERAAATHPWRARYQAHLGRAWQRLYARSTSQRRRPLFFIRARQGLEQAVVLSPQNPLYRGDLGRLYLAALDHGEAEAAVLAERHLLEAIERAPLARSFYQDLFEVYARSDRPDRLAEIAAGLRASDPGRAGDLYSMAGDALLNAGALLRKGGDAARGSRYLELAEVAYANARRLLPQSAQVAYSHAVTLLLAEREDESRSELEAALSLDPGHEGARSLKARQGW